MKNALAFAACLWASAPTAQNLVLNPSFEEAASCPLTNWQIDGFGSIENAIHWFSPATSTDYYSTCYNPLYPTLGVPNNMMGYQQPKEGKAFAGMFVYSKPIDPGPTGGLIYREYAEGRLSSPLQKDSVYRGIFFVSLADHYSITGAVDRMGMLFHSETIGPDTLPFLSPFIISRIPQIENIQGRLLTDTADWIPICGFFRAVGGEQFLTIGNFRDNDNSGFKAISTNVSWSIKTYYYVDDVSVERSSLDPFSFVGDATVCRPDSALRYELPPICSDALWSTGDTSLAATISGEGTYWVRAAIGGCYFTDTFSVRHTPAPLLAAPDTLLACSSDAPLKLGLEGCCAETLWSTGDTAMLALLTENGPYWVWSKNLCGELSDTFTVLFHDPPYPSLGPDTAFCGQPLGILLSAPEGAQGWRWHDGSAERLAVADYPGAYALTAWNACGSFSDTLAVLDIAAMKLDLGADMSRCFGPPVALAAQQGFDRYLWQDGSTGAAIQATAPGTYWVRASNACGEQADTLTLAEAQRPSLWLPATVDIALGDSAWLAPTSSHALPLRYEWSPPEGLSCAGCEATWASPWASTVYRLSATDPVGCAAEASVTVRVTDKGRIYLPNVFSPESGGPNAALTVGFGPEFGQMLWARVFDRWGEMVTEAGPRPCSPVLTIWDGGHRGRPAAPGVYAVALAVTTVSGEQRVYAFDVTLVR